MAQEFLDSSIIEPIEIRMIRPSAFPVRYKSQLKSPELVNLKSSIKEHGLLQPIIVRPLEHGFEIVAGHRRFVACKSLRWRFIPCKIREFSDKQAYEIQLTENVQRKSMDPLEEAEAYQKYVVDFGWGGVSDLAKKIGKSEEYVSHRMQLLKLPEDIKNHLTNQDLSVSQALEVTNIDPDIKSKIVEEIVSNKMTVRQIREMKTKIILNGTKYGEDKINSKKINLIRKTTLSLKVSLSRLDDLIEEAHDVNSKDQEDIVNFLMNLRRKTHSMIDETIKYKKVLSKL